MISSTTGKMCTKTINCPQHTDEMRQQIRLQLLGKHVDIEAMRATKTGKKKVKINKYKVSVFNINIKKKKAPVVASVVTEGASVAIEPLQQQQPQHTEEQRHVTFDEEIVQNYDEK